MKIDHTPAHSVLLALVSAALLVTLSDARAQSGAATVFEGRPAMAGAQGGMGAQSGMPQGGLGVQGNEAAERGLRLSKPSQLDEMQQARRAGVDPIAAADTEQAANLAVRKDIKPVPDRSLAKDQRSATRKISKAAKRTISRAKHGTSPIDTVAP